MTFSRRTFMKRTGVAGILLTQASFAPIDSAPPLLVNHLGFLPTTRKFCLHAGTLAVEFEIVEIGTGIVAYRGAMTPVEGDLGAHVVGDFSRFQRSGAFYVRSNRARSEPFRIDPHLYDTALEQFLTYFSRQRCGASKTGHHAPCHVDDGRRMDNHQHQDVSGGWHDACDLRKWVDATIYGIIGLCRLLDRSLPSSNRAQILDELRWGNTYFRKMQEPAGYVMNYCGGDDGNRYTDNIPGTADDRPIHVEPCELPAQFQFVAAQAAMARHTRDSDAIYSAECERAARNCLRWCLKNRSPDATPSLSAALMACCELNRLTREEQFGELAAGFAGKLLKLQVQARESPLSGFFRTAPDNAEPWRDVMYGNLPAIALCDLLAGFPDHRDAKLWRGALQSHVNHLLEMSRRSAFGTLPFGLYARRDPGGNRRAGDYWYRWFMKRGGEKTASSWWVGINAHLASNGIALIRASRLLEDPRLAELAQRQLDWIVGVNPFNASTISGIGRNQPEVYVPGAFRPPTPLIPGGVMNGLGGTDDDNPALDPGSWNTCEYWTPMVAYTMWLMAEMS